jgi:hypothetical protein
VVKFRGSTTISVPVFRRLPGKEALKTVPDLQIVNNTNELLTMLTQDWFIRPRYDGRHLEPMDLANGLPELSTNDDG